jgi:two-component system, NtrC family, nitrogen regulation response regulator NtrX
MNPVTQAKVLRALENRTIERLGGSQSVDIDVRVVSATHRDLEAEISAGRFRQDLYYRLRVVTLEIPPLRAHKEDLPLLVEAFLAQLGARHMSPAPAGRRVVGLSRQAMDQLERYDWPGNVRELRNALERSLVLCPGHEIGPADLPEEIRENKASLGPPENGRGDSLLDEAGFREAKRKFEIAYLKRKLEEHRWNVSQTAAEIGLQRQSLQEKLRELGIQRPGKEPR